MNNSIENQSVSSLEEWNLELVENFLPNRIVLVFYLVLGIVGNTITLLVYGFRMKITNERYLIPVLSLCDMLASTVCSAYGIVEHGMPVTFTNSQLCKILNSIGAFFTLFAALILIVIAVQRYMKVCLLVGKELTKFWMRVSLCVMLIYSLILSVITAILYEPVEVFNANKNLTEFQCRIGNDYAILLRVYGFIILAQFIISISLLLVIYGRISAKLFQHFKRFRRTNPLTNTKKEIHMMEITGADEGKRNQSETSAGITRVKQFLQESSNESDVDGDNDTTIIDDSMTLTSVLEENDGHGKCGTPEISNTNNSCVENSETSCKKGKAMKSGDTKLKKSKKRKTTNVKPVKCTVKTSAKYKLTIVFLIITIFFIVCYIPKVILLVLEGVNTKFDNLSKSTRGVVKFISELFVINNIINPFVYAFLDTKFQNECKMFFKCAK